MRIAQIKDIEDFSGYRVTSDGRILGKRVGVLRQSSVVGNYKSVSLCKNGKVFTKLVHRLVAEAFIPNPENLPDINHKDEDPTNNDVNNLEWCTRKYNNNYGTRKERQSRTQLNRPDCSKRVKQYDKNGKFIAEYPSLKEANRQTSICRSGIARCCDRNKQSTAGGYVWEWG